MNQIQPFNFSADFQSSFPSIFLKLIFAIIAVYCLVLIMNFLRDKFINKATDTRKDDISGLLIILNKIFRYSGFGFIIGNLVQVLILNLFISHKFPATNSKGEWGYLIFGIILIFIGIGFEFGKQALDKYSKNY